MKSNLIKILLVDDSQDNLQVMLNSLFMGGYLNILCARDGADALEIVNKEKPHLIILDWDMPVMNGIAVLKKLKENPDSQLIPVIIATGAMISPKNLEEALTNGAVDYIRKPYDETELLARVKSGLDSSMMLSTIEAQRERIEKQNLILEENEMRLTALLNALDQACVFIEKDIVIETSQMFCNYTGFSKEEIIGHSIFNYFPPEYWKMFSDPEKCKGDHMSVALLNVNGESIPIELRMKPISYKNKNVLAVTFLTQCNCAPCDKLTDNFIDREAVICRLDEDVQALKKENKELLNQLQFEAMRNACCNDFMVELLKKFENFCLLSAEDQDRLQREVAQYKSKGKQYFNNHVWNEFRLRFAMLHTDFYDKLVHRFPALTENDLRLCAFIKLKMSTKEIAIIINQPVNSVKIARNRLRSKLLLKDSSESLLMFLSGCQS